MKKITLLIILLLCSGFLFAQTMKYNFNIGEKIDVEQIANVEVNQNLMGMEMGMTTVISNSLVMELESVEGDVAKLKSWYTNVAMDFYISSGEGEPDKLHVNSSETPTEEGLLEAHNMIKSMINEPYYIHLRNNGEIVKIDGIEKLEAKMRAVVTQEETLKSLGKDFGEEKLRADFARFFVTYPHGALAQGDSWISSISIPDLELYEANQSWRVEKIDAENNTVDFVASIKDIKINKKENEVEMNIGGDMNTVYKVKASSGWPQLIKVNSNMTGTAKMMQNGEEFSWPVDMKMSSQISFKSN